MYRFKAYGHENVLSTHRNTVEFTKHSHLTKRGDCILGVNADFDLKKIKEMITEKKREGSLKTKIIIKSSGIKDEINAELNPDFSSEEEMVIRKTSFLSGRTFAVNADKAAKDLSKKLVQSMKNPSQHIDIFIY